MEDEKPVAIKSREVKHTVDTSSSSICVTHADPCNDSVVPRVWGLWSGLAPSSDDWGALQILPAGSAANDFGTIWA
jgi:hypothetical protein